MVFAPKFRRQVIYGKLKGEIGKMLRKLCEYKGIEILEANACPDHIHMLLVIPPKNSIAQVIGYLKGKSSLMIFDKFANMKYKYGNRHFWCKGYYVSTVTYFYGYFYLLDLKTNRDYIFMRYGILHIYNLNILSKEKRTWTCR